MNPFSLTKRQIRILESHIAAFKDVTLCETVIAASSGTTKFRLGENDVNQTLCALLPYNATQMIALKV